MSFNFDNTYADQLKGFYSTCDASRVPTPNIIKINNTLAVELGLKLDELSAAQQLAIFSGNTLPEEAKPLAQVYAGHQFGNFVPQLGKWSMMR